MKYSLSRGSFLSIKEFVSCENVTLFCLYVCKHKKDAIIKELFVSELPVRSSNSFNGSSIEQYGRI